MNSSAERPSGLQESLEDRWGDDLLKNSPGDPSERVEQGVHTPWHARRMASVDDRTKEVEIPVKPFVDGKEATDHPYGRSDSDLDPNWNVPIGRLTKKQKKLNAQYIGKMRNLIVHPK